jgi:O-antigen/teichoic acid export membrane protein
MDDNLRRNMLTVSIANVALPLAAFAASPILAQTLGVEGRGSVSAALAPLMLATAVGTVGIPEAVNYFVARRPDAIRGVVSRAALMLLASGALATIVSMLIAPILAGGDLPLMELIIVSSLATVPTLMIGAVRGGAQGLHQWKLVNAEKYLTASSRLIGLIGLGVSGFLTPLSATLVMMLSPLLGGICYFFLKQPAIAPLHSIKTGELLNYGSRVWAGSLSGVFLSRVDQVLMTPLGGAYALGLYAIAVNIADVVPIINHAVRDVIFSADAQDRNDERIYRAARISFLISIGIGATIAATLWLWLPLLFGEAFTPALWPAIVLVASAVLGIPGSIAGASLSARGRPGLRSIGLSIATVLNIALLFALVPTQGALGGSVATFIGSFVASNLNIVFLKRVFGMKANRFYRLEKDDFLIIWSAVVRFLRRDRRQK